LNRFQPSPGKQSTKKTEKPVRKPNEEVHPHTHPMCEDETQYRPANESRNLQIKREIFGEILVNSPDKHWVTKDEENPFLRISPVNPYDGLSHVSPPDTFLPFLPK